MEPSFYRATGGGNPEEQFVVKDRMTAYTSAQRSSMVMQILQRARCDDTAKVSQHFVVFIKIKFDESPRTHIIHET